MKKVVFLLISFFMIVSFAMAKGTYTTQSGIEMDKDNYKRLCEIYSKGYIETLTIDEYNTLMEDNLEHVQKVTHTPTRGDFYGDLYKEISIVKNGSLVTLTAYWDAIPAVNSYDVIAIRRGSGVSTSNHNFKQIYKSGGNYYTIYNGNYQSFTNGYGYSALLHSGTDQEYVMTFKVSGSGYVFGSYQHATSNVTLNQSKNYTLSSSGYGGVILFDSSVASYYDAMYGVDLYF